jgi:hypothetical protein
VVSDGGNKSTKKMAGSSVPKDIILAIMPDQKFEEFLY